MSVAGVPFGYFVEDQNRPLKYLFPLVALLALITFVRDWRASLRDRLFRACAAFGLAGIIGCFPRADIAHISFVTPLVCPLLTYCTRQILLPLRSMYRYALVTLVIILCIPSIGAFSVGAYTALHGKIIETPRGRVTVLNNEVGNLIARIVATPPADPYFFYPRLALLPFLTGREHVSKYDILIPTYSYPSQYQDACISAMRRASWLVIDRTWTTPNLTKAFPAIRDAEPPETKKFERALGVGFELVAHDGPFELRRRVESASENVCIGIAE
jgi:hypothetical protein